MWHADYPMAVEGGFSYYTVSRLARNSVKVTLTGHGGDEIFAGYPAQFRAAYGNTDMFPTRLDPFRSEVSSFLENISRRISENGARGIFRSFVNMSLLGSSTFEDLWVQSHCGYSPEKNPVYRKSFVRELQGYSPREEYLKSIRSVKTDKILDKCLYHDLRVYLPSLLHLEDRMSMALSIESRVPLLDYRIVELLAQVPPEQKVKNMVPKHLLRGIASSVLPENIWKRKEKFPFPVPGKFWHMKNMVDLSEELLLGSGSLNRGIFEPKQIQEACGNRDKHLLWSLINVELWNRIFLDRDGKWLSRVESKGKSEGLQSAWR
jgi:asparagine synthase (glutamine-hydrolysing)